MGTTTVSGAGARPGRSELQLTEGFFQGRSRAAVCSLALIFTAVLLLVDYRTGPRVSFSLFYLMPLGLMTWNFDRRTGVATAFVVTVASLAADITGFEGEHDLVPYWNSLARFAVFLVFALLVSTLKHGLDAQRARAELEREVSSGLREMNDVKDTLLHAVSHDLKGPLAGIIGAMSTLRRNNELQLSGDEVESLYQMIEGSGRKMNRLIDDMLDLERLDRGQVQPEREPTDVGEMVRRVSREAPGMDMHPVRIESVPLLANIDPAKVERIVENLLVNAARHTPGGTPIHVSVTARDEGVVLVVEDEGPGVPDELRSTLFDPFRQGPTAAGRGVGIGLSLVRRFAELHGGSADIEDREGGGARFVVELPCQVKPFEESVGPRLRAV